MRLKDKVGIELFLFNPETEDIFSLLDKMDYVYLFNITEYLKSNPGEKRAYLSDLAEFFETPVSSVSRIIRKLENKGYVIWKMDENHERTYVELSNIAVELLKAQKEKLIRCSKIVHENIPEEELETTQKTLEKIQSIVHKMLEKERIEEEEELV